MVRKLFCGVILLGLCVGVTLADEFRAVITKVDGDNVTFAPLKGKEKGDEKTMPVVANVKVVKGKFNKETKKTEAGDAIEGGLKAKVFASIGEKGVGATIVTDDDNKKITEIRVTGGGKKKKAQR